MRVKKRRLPNFEACSVALFASLALYGPLPSKAQSATSSTALSATSADADRQLSRKEASTLPGLARRQLDANKDGSISSAEFDEALK